MDTGDTKTAKDKTITPELPSFATINELRAITAFAKVDSLVFEWQIFGLHEMPYSVDMAVESHVICRFRNGDEFTDELRFILWPGGKTQKEHEGGWISVDVIGGRNKRHARYDFELAIFAATSDEENKLARCTTPEICVRSEQGSRELESPPTHVKLVGRRELPSNIATFVLRCTVNVIERTDVISTSTHRGVQVAICSKENLKKT